jgi:hypothetical protein
LLTISLELLFHPGVLLQQDLEDVLPPGLDLGIVARAEPPEQLLTRWHLLRVAVLGLLRRRRARA